MYADVNGINLYYERHGSGRPMILLHGGLGSGEMFGPIGGWMGEGRPKGGHALAILPCLTHYNMAESRLVAATILDFLDS